MAAPTTSDFLHLLLGTAFPVFTWVGSADYQSAAQNVLQKLHTTLNSKKMKL